MKLKTKIPLYTSLTVFISVTFISAFSIISFRNRALESIENYEKEELAKVKTILKDYVDLSYNMIAQSYEKQTTRAMEENYGVNAQSADYERVKMLAMHSMQITLENLRTLRYGKDGYIWINRLEPPYEVVMHASKPYMENKSWVFIMDGTNTNVYDAFADVCKQSGKGFLEYSFPKPGQIESVPKLSYIRLFEPLGWVIGTGDYIDNLDRNVQQKTDALQKQVTNLVYLTTIIGIALIAFASGLLYYLGHNITNAITRVSNQLLIMAKGMRTNKLQITSKDEIGEMGQSLDVLIDGLDSYTEFAHQIGEENLDAKFDPLSDKDELGNSLLEMRESLKAARKAEELREIENKNRSWVAEGLSLVNDVVRKTRDDMQETSSNIVSTLVRYLNANQGGLFLLNEQNPDDKYIELVASFAYDRKRFHQKRLELGEGIVGACFFEQKSIIMNKLPEDYMEIRSGLGTAGPSSLVVVPLMVDNDVIGVMEVASFDVFQQHEIEFIERVANNVSYSLFTSKSNYENENLLEKFRRQAEEQEAQEAAMRESFAELEALKEELRKQSIKNG